MNRREWYERVNAAWPADVPKLTGPEALKAVRRLFRFCKVARQRLELTSGRRHTWYRRGVFYVNPDQGWRTLVHSVSHWAHYVRNPNEAPHAKAHARTELRLIKQVLRRGWLDGRLKPAPKLPAEAPPMREQLDTKLEHARRMLARAVTRAKRAETIRKKWARRVSRLEKRAAPVAQAS